MVECMIEEARSANDLFDSFKYVKEHDFILV